MSENLTPKEILKAHLTHSTRLNDVNLDIHTRALPCEFPTIERYEYLQKGAGHLIIVAARPGNGKTAFACQVGLNVSKHGRTLYFSLEMKNEALRKRLLAVTSGIPIKKLAHPAYKTRLEAAIKEQASYRFDMIDDDGLTVDQIIVKTKDEHQKEPVDLVIIDYIGLIKMTGDNRAQAMSIVAKRIKKEIAEPLKVPVIVLGQMKRGFEERFARAKLEYEKAKQYPTGANSKILDIRPSLEDLGESSGLEHNADVVMFLHRPCLVNPEESPSLFKVFLAKNRNGDVKDFDLEFSQELTRFIDRGTGDVI